jgi:hypothetical protein
MLSGQTTASAALDTNVILVGDQVKLELSLKVPLDYKVFWPVLTDTITSEIEIVSRTHADTIIDKKNNSRLIRQQMMITSFDSGYWVLPPFKFTFKAPGDPTLRFAESEALLLEVHTLSVNLSEEIKDIKKPLEAPFSFREALPWIILLLALGGSAFGIYYYLKKWKRQEPVFRIHREPKLPPHQAALDALENLRHKKLWQGGMIKEYHTELTDIIREYLSAGFGIHAHELTTYEIMEMLEKTAVNQQARSKLSHTLITADMVKFAKFQPLPLEHDQSYNHAVDFIKESRQMIIIQSPAVEESPTENKEVRQSMDLTGTGSDNYTKPVHSEGKEVSNVQ